MNYFDADWKNFNDFFNRKKVMGNASNNKIQQSSSSSILYTVTVLSVYITMRLNIGNRNKKFIF